jgi:hypothetical protein
MRRLQLDDPWVESMWLRSEERFAEARARAARRASLRDARPAARRRARRWLGSLLLALAHRLLAPAPGSAAPGPEERGRRREAAITSDVIAFPAGRADDAPSRAVAPGSPS